MSIGVADYEAYLTLSTIASIADRQRGPAYVIAYGTAYRFQRSARLRNFRRRRKSRWPWSATRVPATRIIIQSRKVGLIHTPPIRRARESVKNRRLLFRPCRTPSTISTPPLQEQVTRMIQVYITVVNGRHHMRRASGQRIST